MMVGKSTDANSIYELRCAGQWLAMDACIGERARIIYCGPDIPGAAADELERLWTAQHLPGGPEKPIAPTLLNEIGVGTGLSPGLETHRGGHDWAPDLRVADVRAGPGEPLHIVTQDGAAGIEVTHTLTLNDTAGVFEASTRVRNIGADELTVTWCAALCLPIGVSLTQICGFTGRWAHEFQVDQIEQFTGDYVRENRAGRTSHDTFPGLYLGAANTCERQGPAAAFHLGWSGNHTMRLERSAAGAASLQMGELLLPGEMILAGGEDYVTPTLYAVWSDEGYGDVTRRLHRFVRRSIVPATATKDIRPVHYNTWEAVYFNHDEARLMELAERAAAAGAERFVLDDGWFAGRRSDCAGLGDWWVSDDVYPCGLHPLADHVGKLGMEFGLWVEPEMVNPDSDLYRAHPDWVLRAAGASPIASRAQLTLDLTRPQVFDYLFAKLDALLTEYPIGYLKWDMNRDTQHPGSHGKPAMHRQTHAVYALIDTLRNAHPGTEIESCASGGGRADYGILQRTDRIWTSDNNDARCRHAIMRGAGHFFPLAILGNHVGPRKCHITGRIFSMEYRAGTAIFGHMGIECDLAAESSENLAMLSKAVALHKRHRTLIHGGDYFRGAAAREHSVVGCVSADRGEALVSYALLDTARHGRPHRLTIPGIDPARQYRIRQVWPLRDVSLSQPSIVDAADLLRSGSVFSGAALTRAGIQVPLTHPDTCLIYHLTAEDEPAL